MAVVDRLLSEVDRQQKYLSKLPADFPFPLFNAKVALESQRTGSGTPPRVPSDGKWPGRVV